MINLLYNEYFTTGFQKLVLLNILLHIEELNNITLKWQIAVVCLIIVILQELHKLLGQMDLLKYKKQSCHPSENVFDDTPEN